MKKKEFWEKRNIKTASFSLKKTISLSIEYELEVLKSEVKLQGWTELNKAFLCEKTGLDEKNLDNQIWNFIISKTDIKDREYSKEFRKFLAKKIMDKAQKREQKERMEEYVKNKEFE